MTTPAGCKSCALPGGRRNLRSVILNVAALLLLGAAASLVVLLPGARWAIIAGMAVGATAAVFTMIAVVPGALLSTADSEEDLDATVATVRARLEAVGCRVLDTIDPAAELDIPLPRRVRIVPWYPRAGSTELLTEAPAFAALLPHRLAVYETPDGTVRVTRLNARLIGTLNGGAPAEHLH